MIANSRLYGMHEIELGILVKSRLTLIVILKAKAKNSCFKIIRLEILVHK